MSQVWQRLSLSRAARSCAGLMACLFTDSYAAEWRQFRGPNHNATSSEKIKTDWSGPVSTPVWRVHLTNGLTSLTVSGGRVFTQVRRNIGGNKAVCLALSAADGSELWSTVLDSGIHNDGGVGLTDDGPRSTPVVDGSSVYVYSSYQQLYRLNATNGAIIWSTNLLAGFGGSVIPWQSAASPVIENGLIYVHVNCGSGTLMAINAANGTVAWRSQNEGMTHATPTLVTMNGMRQIIFATDGGLVSLNPSNGALLWKSTYPFGYNTSLAASPAVYENIVFITAAYDMGSAAVRIDQNGDEQTPVPLWANPEYPFFSHWSTPVCYQGALFGQFTPDDDTADFRCVDLTTGEVRWSAPDFGRGSTLLVGTNLLIITERGDLVLAEANTNQFVELQRFTAITGFDGLRNKCWNALALSDGQLYVRSTAYAARFDLSVPDNSLKLDPPVVSQPGKVNLTVRMTAGTPVAPERLTNMEVRASANPGLPPATWPKLTNELILSGGVVNVTNVSATPPRFFIVSEPE